MSYAGVSDVQVSLGRPLTEDEESQADALLDRVERRIYARISDLDDRLAAEVNLTDLLVEIEADAVARKIDNPRGVLQEQDGDYMYTLDRSVLKSGGLALTDDEWGRLGVSKGAFTIGTSLGREFDVEPALSDAMLWEPYYP